MKLNRFWIIVAAAGASALLAGCSSSLRADAPDRSEAGGAVPLAAAPAGEARSGRSGQQPRDLPVIDLTEPGEIARTIVEPEIIDTHAFEPQIQLTGPHEGPTRLVKNLLPAHSRDKRIPEGEDRSGVPVGGVAGRSLLVPLRAFPGIEQTPWTPPDPSLAVGPEHVVQVVNMAIAFFDKEGNQQFSAPLGDPGNPGFFENQGARDFTFDPKCFYDHHADRFVVIALEVYNDTRESFIDIAVSDDSDPNGVWFKYRTPSVISIGNAEYWVDYPGLGFDDRGYYITGNLFRLSGSGPGFAGALFRVFDKQPLLVGDPARFTDLREGGAASVQAAQHFGTNGVPLFAQLGSTTSVVLWAVRDPLGSPDAVFASVAVPEYDAGNPTAPNRGGGRVSTLAERVMNVQARDDRLYIAHTNTDGTRTRARWYEIDANGWPDSGSPQLVQSGEIDPGPGTWTFFPAIYANAAGELAMVLAQSASTEFVSMQATSRLPDDPPGFMRETTQITIGDSGAAGRWGDYFDIAVDPTDDRLFWIIGQRQLGFGWQTWVESLLVRCAADLTGPGGDGEPDGTLTSDDFFFYLGLFAQGCP